MLGLFVTSATNWLPLIFQPLTAWTSSLAWLDKVPLTMYKAPLLAALPALPEAETSVSKFNCLSVASEPVQLIVCLEPVPTVYPYLPVP